VVQEACRWPRGPGSDGRESSPEFASATLIASADGATTGTPDYCKPVVGNQLDCRDGTRDGRRNRDASGQQA
jgi:hypothetical protein